MATYLPEAVILLGMGGAILQDMAGLLTVNLQVMVVLPMDNLRDTGGLLMVSLQAVVVAIKVDLHTAALWVAIVGRFHSLIFLMPVIPCPKRA